jgi:hypothetical protein
MNWTDTEERSQFVERQGLAAARSIQEASHALVVPSVADAVEAGLNTDSPIEAVFSVWFNAARDHLCLEGMQRFALVILPQFWVESQMWRYRLDFAMGPADADMARQLLSHNITLRVAIELDGHDYHEKTREQVIARNRRDRDFSGAGWRLLHFSGSELIRNPMAVAVEALVAGADALEEVQSLLLLQR